MEIGLWPHINIILFLLILIIFPLNLETGIINYLSSPSKNFVFWVQGSFDST